MKKIFTLCILAYLFVANITFGFDDVDTHPRITKLATEKANIDNKLKSQLGINEGFNKLFKNTVTGETYSAFKWLWIGSIAEDSPTCRASNHFHNPLLPWDQSYMTDDTTILGSMIRSYCNVTGWPYSDRKSNVTWGTGYLSPSPDGAKITIDKQQWGWDNGRDYYYKALTSSSATERETNFANTFQTLGQVVHLLEDMAVPAHVRNDFTSHLSFTGIDSITQNFNPISWVGNPFEHYVKNNPGLVSGTSAIPSFTLLTDFWDTDGASNNGSLGLSEFTNGNYFSDETIPNNNPTSEHSFPSPQVSSTNTQICDDYAPGSIDIRKYISRNVGNPCSGAVDHFATPSLLNEDSEITNDNISTLQLWLDDNVHNTYAKELLPRAVGYSAGLLNYFFRGKVNMEKDPQNAGKYIIKNESSEKMEGTFTIYYDDTSGNRNAVPGTSWALTINPNSTSSPVTFTEPTSPAPKEKGKYILVFNGKLGMEEGAVAGFVYNPKWAFLVIKQTSIKSDVVEWGCTGCENEWGYFTDSAHKASGMGHLNSYVLKFDLEWLGAVNTITNVVLIDFYNYGSCEYNTTGDLNTTNEHTISLIRPTANTPKGYIEVRLKGNKERYWPFPRFIRVDTIGKEGNPQSFYEPILLASSSLHSRSEWDVGQYGDYYKNRELNAVSYIPYMGMCVSGKVSANYTFDLSEPSYDRGYIYSDYVRYYMYSVSEGYHKSYQQEPLLSFFPYTVEKLKIKRTWKQSTLDFLESVGYDIIELPTWDIYIDYWRTDYRP